MSYQDAVTVFAAEARSGWASLPFFTDGSALALAARLDARSAAGAQVLPAAPDMFTALRTTPLEAVKAVILGQDPYPTAGNAHGLAFSVRPGRRIPQSLVNIFRELDADLGHPRPPEGILTPWAANGVLLFNACLTVEAGDPGCHRKLGWERLADEVVAAVSAAQRPSVFILWGNDARRRGPLIDRQKHLVLESVHPSPQSVRGGFFGSRPFSRANAFLRENGRGGIDWRLDGQAS